PAVRGEGGIVQFRNACPGDPDLLGWSGLVLASLGRWEQALSEFTRALDLRPHSWRLAWYCAAAHCRVHHGRVSAENLLATALELAASAGLEPAEFAQLNRQAGQPQPEFFPL
ncbi:MAG TPA: hypothetical protein VI566_07185, partial [Xanthomonadales bacterium]|nr:hypothetical protein [Xanthomonadales bacterium]